MAAVHLLGQRHLVSQGLERLPDDQIADIGVAFDDQNILSLRRHISRILSAGWSWELYHFCLRHLRRDMDYNLVMHGLYFGGAMASSTRSIRARSPTATRTGLGDLPGITAHLDYLADLGVSAIWLSPFYPDAR